MPNTLYRLLAVQRTWIVLFVLVVVIAVIGAMVLSHIDMTRVFPIHLGFVSEHWS